MTTITGYTFDTVDGAQRMLTCIQELAERRIIRVEDAAVVTWPASRERPVTRHLSDMTAAGGLDDAFWGMLFGLIFFIPSFGMAVSASAGGLTGHFSAYGINKDFISRARDGVTQSTSALFLLTGNGVQEDASDMATLCRFDFDAFGITLSSEQEKQLHRDFCA